MGELNNRGELICVVKDIWNGFDRSLYEIIPRRIQAVIKAKGQITNTRQVYAFIQKLVLSLNRRCFCILSKSQSR